jgi:cation transport regulator ChaB
MRYETKSDLPRTVTDVLPEEAQSLYLEGYQWGWENYEDIVHSGLSREAVAHRQGWDKVKDEFEHDEETGDWCRKDGEREESDKDAGLVARVKEALGLPDEAD